MTNGTVLVLVIHDPFLERCIDDGFDRELLDLVSCWTSNVLQDDVLQGGTRRLFLLDELRHGGDVRAQSWIAPQNNAQIRAVHPAAVLRVELREAGHR